MCTMSIQFPQVVVERRGSPPPPSSTVSSNWCRETIWSLQERSLMLPQCTYLNSSSRSSYTKPQSRLAQAVSAASVLVSLKLILFSPVTAAPSFHIRIPDFHTRNLSILKFVPVSVLPHTNFANQQKKSENHEYR